MRLLRPYLKLLRLNHWIKNLFIALPAFFGEQLLHTQVMVQVGITIISFCLIASAVYIWNDFFDLKEDRKHPVKKNRPLAKGTVSRVGAGALMTALLIGGLLIAWRLDRPVLEYCTFYVLLNLIYSIKLKHVALIDIFIVAFGFVLRLFIGAAASHAPLSMWIILSTFLLALLLVLGKRRNDLLIYHADGEVTRKVVKGYNPELLHAAMVMTAAIVVICYVMYTVSPAVMERLGTPNLYMTAIFVLFGVLRYLQITFVEERSGSPTKILLRDRSIQLTVLGWILTFAALIYLM